MPQEAWKIALFGDGAVGKTAIAVKFTRGTFLETYDPTIEDSYRLQFQYEGKAAFLEIIDTAGQDDYATLRDQWLHEGDAYILVYAVSSKKSFQRIVSMGPAITRARAKSAHIYPVSMLIGNKSDLADEGYREVGREEGAELAKRFGCEFLETSAKTGRNIRRLFEDLTAALRARAAGVPSRAPPGTLWDRSNPSSPLLTQSPSSFRGGRDEFSPPGYSPGAPGEPFQSRSRQGSVPNLRTSASAHPLPHSRGPYPPSPGGMRNPGVRGRSSTTALRSPVIDSPPPPLPPPRPPPPRTRAEAKEMEKREKAAEKERARKAKEKRKEMERREREEGRRGKDGGKCVIC